MDPYPRNLERWKRAGKGSRGLTFRGRGAKAMQRNDSRDSFSRPPLSLSLLHLYPSHLPGKRAQNVRYPGFWKRRWKVYI